MEVILDAPVAIPAPAPMIVVNVEPAELVVATVVAFVALDDEVMSVVV